MKSNMQIYVTGAFLSPEMLTDETGHEFWVWVVDEFDDSPKFLNGEELCGGAEAVADTEGGLLPGLDEDKEEE